MSTQEKPTTSLAKWQRIPFEKEVLKFLLKHEASIVNPVVRSFVRRYVKWFYDCVNQEVTLSQGNEVELVRWTSSEDGSYGYDPADIAYYLHKLNQLFFMVMGNAYIRLTQQETLEELPPINLQFSIQLLKGLSPCLGFYVLANYFAVGLNIEKRDQEWINRTCDLFGEFRNLEAWRPSYQTVDSVEKILGSSIMPYEPYYHTKFLSPARPYDPRTYQRGQIPDPYIPYDHRQNQQSQDVYKDGFSKGYEQGHRDGYKQCMEQTNVPSGT